MARASTKTWLPLDRWAEIMGLDPLHFNQLHSIIVQSETTCGDPWYQYAWQDANKISREDIARAIRQAENKISRFVGYNLIPDWTVDERLKTTRPARPDMFSTGLNIRGMQKSVTAGKGYIIAGGVKLKTFIANAAVVRSDDDGDGYAEVVTLIQATTVTDPCEIHAYYPNQAGKDEWEIKPIEVSIVAGIATILLKSWQIVDPDLQEGFGVQIIDADDVMNYMITVDLYQVHNDVSQQVSFVWEDANCLSCGGSGCTACQVGEQSGCLVVRDDRLGIVVYRPATWNTTTEVYDSADYAVSRDPERLRLWYYSGWQDKELDCPLIQMDRYWEMVVAYYAASLLDRDTCGCDNVKTFINHWREDLTETNEQRSYMISPSQIENSFGTTRGALYARTCCTEEGRTIGR